MPTTTASARCTISRNASRRPADPRHVARLFAVRASCPEAAPHGEVASDRNDAPCDERAQLGCDRRHAREQAPRGRSECHEPEAAEARTDRVDRRFVLAVLLGDQCEARRQDRREREEQSCDPVPGRQPDRTDDDRDREAEREPDRQAPEAYVPEPRWFERDAFLGAVELEQRLVPAHHPAEVHRVSAVTAPYASVATTPHETKAS